MDQRAESASDDPPAPSAGGRGGRAAHALRAWASGRRGRWRAILLWSLVGLVLCRVAAPYALTAIINRQLAAGGAIQGRIQGLTLGLLSGHYAVHGLELTVASELDPGARIPLLELERLDCLVYWSSALRGALEGEIAIHALTLHVTPRAPAAPPQRAWSMDDWRRTVTGLARFRIARATVADCRLVYSDELRRIHAEVTGIAGTVDDLIVPAGSERPATFAFRAVTPGHGALKVDGTALAAEQPRAQLKADLQGVRLPELNPLVDTFQGLAFAAGEFSGYLELSLVGEHIGGYFKPLFHHLEVRSYKQETGSASAKLFWSAVVPVAEYVLKNVPADQHAAWVPISGEVESPDTSVWSILVSALGNAFVAAIAPGYDLGSPAAQPGT
jgi:hypothetical protein